ncbi:hypothetical protein SS322685_3337 [Shigella sonnei 3226-85]|nr:hypothetical protein ECTW10246_3250 [Escherichia coli TW10246]EIQ40121.1 hypothetical protein SS322685_3337 [Shigella sonnei 3226-85]EKH88395.1 hypothetical protein ECMA6_3384 [Escherichia coli MA6]EKW47913.1 hypothetical protein EC960939_3084 [Escherichia coli 96.0939]END43923.1 hypothetical protein EC2854350_0880 [Escherichia coli 2854350]ERC85862.1 hypothetical protein ECT92401_2816 [Escherichia coli T924_01]KEJ62702.1 hypothetical protein AC88_1947 [Escherichia coli 3-267-03_S4_C1]KEM
MIISRPRSPTLKNHLNITHQLTPQKSDQNANYKQKSTKQY